VFRRTLSEAALAVHDLFHELITGYETPPRP